MCRQAACCEISLKFLCPLPIVFAGGHMTVDAIPAAQYLRMSTDHQEYSLDNQAEAIARYAENHGFSIMKTYCDAAKSGVRLKNRLGLRQLLKDVVEGNPVFRAQCWYTT
jgi:predicted site-specific integrase-resolvase